MAYTRCECGGNNLNPCYHCRRQQQQAYEEYQNNLRANQHNIPPYNAADEADREAHVLQFNAELARQQYYQGQGGAPPNNQQPDTRYIPPLPPQTNDDAAQVFDRRMAALYRRYGPQTIDRVIDVLLEAGRPVTPETIKNVIDRAKRQREQGRR